MGSVKSGRGVKEEQTKTATAVHQPSGQRGRGGQYLAREARESDVRSSPSPSPRGSLSMARSSTYTPPPPLLWGWAWVREGGWPVGAPGGPPILRTIIALGGQTQ